MTPLRTQLLRLGWTDVKALNTLTEWGVISDNCVTLSDICESDALKAADWLKGIK